MHSGRIPHPQANRRLNLVRVQVHAGVEQRLAQTLQPAASVLEREVMRDVFGLVGSEQGRSARGRGNESEKTLIVMVLIFEIVRKCGSV